MESVWASKELSGKFIEMAYKEKKRMRWTHRLGVSAVGRKHVRMDCIVDVISAH